MAKPSHKVKKANHGKRPANHGTHSQHRQAVAGEVNIQRARHICHRRQAHEQGEDHVGKEEPEQEQYDDHRAKRGQLPLALMADHAENLVSFKRQAHLQPVAHLVKPHRRERADQRKTHRRENQPIALPGHPCHIGHEPAGVFQRFDPLPNLAPATCDAWRQGRGQQVKARKGHHQVDRNCGPKGGLRKRLERFAHFVFGVGKIEDKRLIVFELDEVKDNKEILSVMLKLIKSAIQRTIWKNRAEKGIILFDEFAKQLKFDNVLESVEFYYQAIRKQNGAIGIILQSINQLPDNSTSASILENTQVIYSLNNEKGYDEIVKRLNLSSHDLNQLKSIKNNLTGPRKYTEMFIKIGKESNIFRLEVPPEVYAAYLTDGKENEDIMAIYKKTNNMEEAIKEFINLKHKKE